MECFVSFAVTVGEHVRLMYREQLKANLEEIMNLGAQKSVSFTEGRSYAPLTHSRQVWPIHIFISLRVP